MKEILKKNGFAGRAIDEVILGQELQGGADQDPARQTIRQAGPPDSVHAMTINKICGSDARLVATLLREMRVRNEKFGLATLCIGGGEAVSETLNVAIDLMKTSASPVSRWDAGLDHLPSQEDAHV